MTSCQFMPALRAMAYRQDCVLSMLVCGAVRHAWLPPSPLPSQIIAICPFLAVDQASPRQWFLRQLTRAPVTLGALAGGIGHLPASLKKLIVTSYAGQFLLGARS